MSGASGKSIQVPPRLRSPTPQGPQTSEDNFPALPQPGGSSTTSRSKRSQKQSAGSPPPPSGDRRDVVLEERMDRVLAQLEAVIQQNAAMLLEMAQLRAENALLRQRLQVADTGDAGLDAEEGSLVERRRSAVRPRAELVTEEESPRTPPGGHGAAAGMSAAMVTDSPAKITELGPKRVHVPLQPPSAHGE